MIQAQSPRHHLVTDCHASPKTSRPRPTHELSQQQLIGGPLAQHACSASRKGCAIPYNPTLYTKKTALTTSCSSLPTSFSSWLGRRDWSSEPGSACSASGQSCSIRSCNLAQSRGTGAQRPRESEPEARQCIGRKDVWAGGSSTMRRMPSPMVTLLASSMRGARSRFMTLGPLPLLD